MFVKRLNTCFPKISKNIKIVTIELERLPNYVNEVSVCKNPPRPHGASKHRRWPGCSRRRRCRACDRRRSRTPGTWAYPGNVGAIFGERSTLSNVYKRLPFICTDVCHSISIIFAHFCIAPNSLLGEKSF